MADRARMVELFQARSGGGFEAAGRAQDELRQLGEAALAGLMAVLRRADLPSLQMQWEAALALAEIGEAALPGLLAVLEEGHAGSRWAAGDAITYLGGAGLIGALRSPDAEARQIAAYGLAHCADDRATPALLEAMRDGDGLVRLGAIKALRRIGDPAAELPLRSALASGVTPRAALIWALQGVQEQAVARMLDDLHLLDAAGENARAGIRQIWESEPGRLLDVLRRGRYVLRARAADALGKLGDPRAVPDLLRALGDEVDMVRGHAAHALGQIGDRRAAAPLLEMLCEPDLLIRWTAAEALGRLGDPSAVLPLLEAWINAGHEMILDVTGEAISRIGEAAHGPLRAALDDPREEVQRAARYILGKLGAPQ